jgi:hypothetical protein
LDLRGRKWREACVVRSFKICNLYQIFLGRSCKEEGWAGHVAHMEDKILVGKPDEKKPLRRHRHRWEDNIRLDLRETM